MMIILNLRDNNRLEIRGDYDWTIEDGFLHIEVDDSELPDYHYNCADVISFLVQKA